MAGLPHRLRTSAAGERQRRCTGEKFAPVHPSLLAAPPSCFIGAGAARQPAIDLLRGSSLAAGFDDFRCGPAGDFGHVIESELQLAQTLGRRPDLDDQVVQLVLRHIGARMESQPSQPSRGSKPRIWPRRMGRSAVMRAIWSRGRVHRQRRAPGSSSTGLHSGSAWLTARRPAVRKAISEESTVW